MPKHTKKIILLSSFLLISPLFSFAATPSLSGRILLQVESRGEAWYINPTNQNRYYMGRPQDAFSLMRQFGTGISNSDLAKIPVGLIDSGEQDDDNDGLSNAIEAALGSDPENADSDNDSYSDKTEISNNYYPAGSKMKIDSIFTNKNAGKIFLQVENKGEAWYISPVDKKRYFLSRPQAAFEIMRKLGLGISNQNLDKIAVGNTTPAISQNPAPAPAPVPETFYTAASAIKNGSGDALNYFTSDIKPVVTYTLNFLDSEGKFNLGNIMAGAKLTNSTEAEKIYSTTIDVAGYSTTLNFHVKKQADGKWLLANL